MSKFIDFDKCKELFYDNLYLDDYKIVVKFPLCNLKNDIPHVEVKIKKFDPTKYIYLLTYE